MLRNLTLAALVGATAVASANLITNDSFEVGNLSGWTANPLAQLGVINPHSGSREADLFGGAVLSQTVATTNGAQYWLSFFFQDSTGDINVYWNGNLVYADAGTYGSYVSVGVGPEVGNGPTGTVSFQTTFNNGAPVFIDDVSLIQTSVPEPAPWACLGLGLFGMLARRRSNRLKRLL